MPFCEKPQNLPRLNSCFTKYKVSRRLTTCWHKLVPPYISACTPHNAKLCDNTKRWHRRTTIQFFLLNPALPWRSQILQKTMPQLHSYQSVIDWWSDRCIHTAAPKINASPPPIHCCPLFALFLVLLHPYGKAEQMIHPTNGQIFSDCFFLIITF